MNLRPAVSNPHRLKIYVPYAGHPPSVNQVFGQHGARIHAALDDWKTNAQHAAEQARLQLHLQVPLPPSIVRITCPMRTATRRDPHNYTGTLCKKIVDGFVAARFWDDDSTGHVTLLDPRFVVMEDLDEPAIRARACALVEIVPLASLREALAAWPVLQGLFDT